NADGYWGISILKSMDHGTTWTNLGLSDFGGLGIGKIAVDPTDSNVLLLSAALVGPPAANNNLGIWRSTDAGTTWQQVLAGTDHTSDGTDVVFDPADPTIAFAALGNGQDTSSGIYRSTDNGAHWKGVLTSRT